MVARLHGPRHVWPAHIHLYDSEVTPYQATGPSLAARLKNPSNINLGQHSTANHNRHKQKECPLDFSPHVLAHERAGLKSRRSSLWREPHEQHQLPSKTRSQRGQRLAAGGRMISRKTQPEGWMLVTSPQWQDSPSLWKRVKRDAAVGV